jgi:hypothetical protein
MPTRLTYGTFNLSSTEILNFGIDREYKINVLPTIGVQNITLPGNLTPITIDLSVSIRDNADTKLNLILTLIDSKPNSDLNFLNKNWGATYLSRINIKSDEIDNTGKLLRFDANLTFICNLGFA